MNTKSCVIFIVMMGLTISSCGQKQASEAILTPTVNASPTITAPTLTPTVTASPTATETPVPTGHTPLPEAVKLMQEAIPYLEQGDDEKAVEIFTKAMEVDPLYGAPYFNRGVIYADHRELEKALADFTKGLELDPAHELGYSNRAQIYFELGKLDEALGDIKSLLNLTKDDYLIKAALTTAGHIYEAQDKTYYAIAAYTAALEMDEFFIPARIGRGQIYLNQGDRLRAFTDLFFARQTTEDPEIRNAITDILVRVYPEGTTVDEAIKASEPYYYKALDYDKAGDYKNAIDSLSKAIEIDPYNSEYYFQRGMEYMQVGDNFFAYMTDMSYLVALGPFESRGYYLRGLAEANAGMASESIKDLEKAIEYNLDSDSKVQANLALKDMRQLQKSCLFKTFKTLNDAERPTFEFTFAGPPNTDFVVAALSKTTGDGYSMTATTPQNGITPTGMIYKLKASETTPIELDIRVRAGNCSLLKTVIWPEIDILAELSGANP